MHSVTASDDSVDANEVIDCPFRDQVKTAERIETARCGLLQQIVGAENEGQFRVGRDACRACRNTYRPSIGTINSVVASFLYAITDRIIDADGIAGCDVDKAQNLQDWAKGGLEIYFPEDQHSNHDDRLWRECCNLGDEIGFRIRAATSGPVRTPVFSCLHSAHSETTELDCRLCRDWSDKNQLGSPPALKKILEPERKNRPAARMRWAVGVTTARRRQQTIEACLESLRRAGWSAPRLFVDGLIVPSEGTNIVPLTLRSPAVGAWPNYYLSLMELLIRQPDADTIMIVQDDAVFYDRVDLRDKLDSLLWLSDPPGIVSLYCSSAYERENAGWYQSDEEWNWGAVAFVFPRERAVQFLSDPQVLEHRWSSRGEKFIDEVIGKWAERNQVPIHFPSPSLVQHIGDSSTLWPNVPAAGYRRAGQFAGDL